MSQPALSTVTGDGQKMHLNPHLKGPNLNTSHHVPAVIKSSSTCSVFYNNSITESVFYSSQSWQTEKEKTQPGALQLTNEFVPGRCCIKISFVFVFKKKKMHEVNNVTTQSAMVSVFHSCSNALTLSNRAAPGCVCYTDLMVCMNQKSP